jgi:hypothetical protein
VTDGDTPIPYKTQSPEEWRREVGSWPWLPAGGGDWGKNGSCSVCQHQMHPRYTASSVISFAVAKRSHEELMTRSAEGPLVATDREGPHTFYVRCDCGADHPGRDPDLGSGCGAYGWIEPPPDDADE